MKTYSIEIKRTSFITVEVEADNQDQAEELAWDKLDNYDEGCADYEVNHVEIVNPETT